MSRPQKSLFHALSSQYTNFNYAFLSAEKRILVQQRTDEIKNLIRRTAQNVIEIGQKLQEVKQQVGHGHFGNWLKAEFNWSVATATKMMQVSEQFKNVNFTNLTFAPSALYLLAAPSIPDEVRSEAIYRAKKGQPITYSLAKELVRYHKSSVLSSEQEATIIEGKAQEIKEDNEQILLTSPIEDSYLEILPWTAKPAKDQREILSFKPVDHLTPMVEPEFLEQYLPREWLRMAREEKFLSFMLCRLDNFSLENKKFNQASEEPKLQLVVQALSQTIKRSTDLFVYYGEGLFLVLLSNTHPEGAIQIAEEIQQNVKLSQHQIPKDHDSPRELITVSLAVCSLIPSKKISLNSLFCLLKKVLTKADNQERDCILTVAESEILEFLTTELDQWDCSVEKLTHP